MKMMSILEVQKKTLAALLLTSMALVMLPGCSSTEESSSTEGDCNCAEGDLQCQEACLQDLPI